MDLSRVVLASMVVLGTASSLPAVVVVLQDIDSASNTGFTFTGVPVTHTPFDDGQVNSGGSASYNATNNGFSGGIQLRTGGLVDRGVMAIKNMFSLIPATDGSGGTLKINSATLYLSGSGSNDPGNANYYPNLGLQINIRRLTTDWLANPAGDNERRVAGSRRNADAPAGVASTALNTSTGQAWLSPGGGIGASDYVSTNAVLNASFAPTAYGQYVPFDVKGMVEDMYAAGTNYGFLISGSTGTAFTIRQSNDTLLTATHETFRPALKVDYEYVAAVPEPVGMSVLALGASAALLHRSVRQESVGAV